MRGALLILAATEPAVFSERGATEGGHRTLPHPTGAALLGWAANAGYDKFGDSFTIFHSGRVRFSNALPLTEHGIPAYPMPQLLMEPKHSRGGIEKSRLVPGEVRLGRPKKQDPKSPSNGKAREAPQFEPLAKSKFVTAAGRVLEPALGGRLRTAVWEGRAAEGQLFGYQHIEPARRIERADSEQKPEPLRFAATLEAEDDVF